MDKFIIKVNSLISKGQARVVRRAAKILVAHDKCDHLFFNSLKHELGLDKEDNIVCLKIGDYIVAREKKPAEKTLCTIVEGA